jgi:hypothetical protein
MIFVFFVAEGMKQDMEVRKPLGQMGDIFLSKMEYLVNNIFTDSSRSSACLT